MKEFIKKLTGFIVVGVLTLALALPIFSLVAPVEAKAEEAEVMTADVFLIAGQSNAAGSTRSNATPMGIEYPYSPKTNVLYYGETHRGVNGASTGRRLADFRPVQHGCGYSDNHVGFELGMANVLNEMEEYKGANKKAIIFKSAAGGTSVRANTTTGSWGSWYPPTLMARDYPEITNFYHHNGLQYRAFMDTLTDFIAELGDLGFEKINVKGLFWMQGESDRGHCSEFADIMTVLISDMRRDIGEITGVDCSDMPFYLGEISSTFGSADLGSVEANANLNATLHSLAGSMKNVYVAPLAKYLINELGVNGENNVLGSDSAHWNYEDITAIGVDFINLHFDSLGLDKYVSVSVDDSAVSNNALSLAFTGRYFGNYNAETEKITFEAKTSLTQKIDSIVAENATLTKTGFYYEEGKNVPIHTYEITGITGDVSLNVKLAQNPSYKVKITCQDTTYGTEPNSKFVKNAYGGCRYELITYPETYGAVEKLIINGKEVPGRIDVSTYVFESMDEFVTEGSNDINVEIVYGEYEAVKAKLEAMNGGSENNGGSEGGENSDEGGCGSAASASGIMALLVAGIFCAFITKRH